MKKKFTFGLSILPFIIFLMVLMLGRLLAKPPAPQGCGVEPVKPAIPAGCDDLEARCVCDEHGENCHWEWVCVKKQSNFQNK